MRPVTQERTGPNPKCSARLSRPSLKTEVAVTPGDERESLGSCFRFGVRIRIGFEVGIRIRFEVGISVRFEVRTTVEVRVRIRLEVSGLDQVGGMGLDEVWGWG